jgi:hypothetical protein
MKYTVIIYLDNGSGVWPTRSFKTMSEAQEFQEHLVFVLGIEAEVL